MINKTAVNFLKHVFDGNVSHMANIVVAEAEGDKDTIRKYLEGIRELIDKWIKEL